MNFFSKKVQLYDSGFKQQPPTKIPPAKKTASFGDLPQAEQQRRAMERIYSGKKNNFGKGVGP